MRKIWIVAASLAALLVIGVAAVLLLVDVNQFRGTIQAQLQKKLHRDVTLGDMGLRLFPLSIRVDNFAIGEDPAFRSSQPFVRAKRMYVRASLLALLQKRIELDSVQLLEPAAELIRNAEGKWNFASLGGNAEGGQKSDIAVGALRISGGAVGVTDQQAKKPRQVYDQIELALNDYAPGRRFSADGRVHLPGSGKQEAAVKLQGMTGGTDMDGEFSLAEVSAGPAMLSGNGTFTSRGALLSTKAKLKAAEAKLGKPVDIEGEAQYDRASGKATVAPLAIRSGGLTIRGKAEAETNATPVVYRADLQSDNAAIAELLRVANAFGFAQGISGTGSLSMTAHVDGRGAAFSYTGLVTMPSASVVPSPGSKPVALEAAAVKVTSSEPLSGTLRAGKLTFDQIVLSNANSDFRVEGGVIRLEPVSATAFGGQVTGNVVVDTRGAGSKLATKAKLSRVDANQLLLATSAVKSISGKLSADADVQLAPVPAGQSPARGLNGTIKLLLTEGKLSGIHLLDQLAQVGKFMGKTNTSSRSFTDISKLAGTLQIQSGLARTDDLQLDFDGGSLTAAGTANLANEVLDLNITALLRKDVSEAVGGSKVGGWMTTVAANPKGELVIPAKVTGTFSKPQFLPDPARLVKMKFGSVGNAAATAQGVLNAITGSKNKQGDNKTTPADKMKPFTDLLDSLGKKKQN